jgi:DNA-binding response OmpR family regulator
MKTILSIDDDKWVLETMKEALSLKGYQVLVADHPDEALRILKETPVDLVMLDLNMPGKNGFALYTELGSPPRMPVLFASACSRSFSAASPEFQKIWTDGFALGMTDILYKPFSLATLYEKVEGLIGDSGVVEHESTH